MTGAGAAMSNHKRDRQNRRCHWCRSAAPLKWYTTPENSGVKLCSTCIGALREAYEANGRTAEVRDCVRESRRRNKKPLPY